MYEFKGRGKKHKINEKINETLDLHYYLFFIILILLINTDYSS